MGQDGTQHPTAAVFILAVMATSQHADAIPLWCLMCLCSHYQQALGCKDQIGSDFTVFKEKRIYPFDCYLLAKQSLLQCSRVPLKLNYSIDGRGCLGELITVPEKRLHFFIPFLKSHTCPGRLPSGGPGKVLYLLNCNIWFPLRRRVLINTDLFPGTINS